MSKRIKKKLVTVPATLDEVEGLVNDLALTVNNHRRIAARMDAAVLKVKVEFAMALTQCATAENEITERLHAWAMANPREFEKRKSVVLPSGTIGFRTGMPKLALLSRKWNWKKALEAVQQYLPAFIRGKPEIDEAAIIGQRDDATLKMALPMCGIKVAQDESFYVEPKLEVVETRQTKEAP